MLCGPVNEFPLLFHSWQEFLITATLLFFFSRNKLVKCHAKCKLINKQKLRILGSLFHSTLLCLMLCPVEGEACDWRGNFFLRTRQIYIYYKVVFEGHILFMQLKIYEFSIYRVVLPKNSIKKIYLYIVHILIVLLTSSREKK